MMTSSEFLKRNLPHTELLACWALNFRSFSSSTKTGTAGAVSTGGVVVWSVAQSMPSKNRWALRCAKSVVHNRRLNEEIRNRDETLQRVIRREYLIAGSNQEPGVSGPSLWPQGGNLVCCACVWRRGVCAWLVCTELK